MRWKVGWYHRHSLSNRAGLVAAIGLQTACNPRVDDLGRRLHEVLEGRIVRGSVDPPEPENMKTVLAVAAARIAPARAVGPGQVGVSARPCGGKTGRSVVSHHAPRRPVQSSSLP
jgi:hypothetical protein